MKVRVLMKLSDNHPYYPIVSPHKILSPHIPVAKSAVPKRKGWLNQQYTWVEGTLISDEGLGCVVQLVTTAGLLAFKFQYRDTNLHGAIRWDEREFLRLCKQHRTGGTDRYNFRRIQDMINEIGMHPNRANYLLYKWTSKGIWDYGTMLWAGWIVNEGRQ